MAQLQSPFPAGTVTQPTLKARQAAMFAGFIVLICAVALASVLLGQRFISPATQTTITDGVVTDGVVTDSWGPAVRAARLERAQAQGRVATDGWSLSGLVQSEPVLDGWALSGLNDD